MMLGRFELACKTYKSIITTLDKNTLLVIIGNLTENGREDELRMVSAMLLMHSAIFPWQNILVLPEENHKGFFHAFPYCQIT